jgi:hypothetical protein
LFAVGQVEDKRSAGRHGKTHRTTERFITPYKGSQDLVIVSECREHKTDPLPDTPNKSKLKTVHRSS